MATTAITLENLLPDDDQDVIIRKTRTTPKTKRQTSELLVLLATQHQYYIKNENTGKITPLVAPNVVPDNTNDTDDTDNTDGTNNTNTTNTPAPIVTNIACVNESHKTRIAKLIKPFIADGIKVGIDHPIQARWLRGIECLLHGTKGAMRERSKDVLCAIAEMIELDYLMANDAAFTSRFITNLKDTLAAGLMSNAIKTINTYGLITLWALTGGNVITDDTEMLGHGMSLYLTRCADKPIMKWIMKHQPFIDALVDMKLRFMMDITIATTPGVNMNEINTPQELTDALFKRIDRVRTFASTMPNTDTKGGKNGTDGKNKSDAPFDSNYSKTQACINLKNSNMFNRWRHITDPVRMYWTDKLFGDAFLDALAIKDKTTGKYYVLGETTDNILGFGSQTIARLTEQLFDLNPIGLPKTRSFNDPRTVDIDKTIRWIRGYMNDNHIQLPKASDVIKNTVLMSSYVSGFVLKSMLNHTITEILFNVRSVLNQAIDMRKSYKTLIMDAHVDPNTIDMYPKYILDAHDEYAVMARLVKNQYLDENIKNVAEQFKWLEETWKHDPADPWHYQAHVLASNDEFVQEGRRMHNCVATYAKKMSHGDTIIVSIRKKQADGTDDTDWLPYITCELNPVTLAQRQTYKSYNTRLDAHDRSIVDSWVKRASAKRIAQHNN